MLVAAACFAATLAVSAGIARAQAIYLGAEGGWNVLPDRKVKAAGLPSAEARYDSGVAAGARLGYEMGRWRFEEEYAYRANDLSNARVGRARIAGLGGSRQSHAIMTNVLYDFNVGWPVSPHLGVGIGAVDIVDEARDKGLGKIVDDDDWQLGYQAIAGVRYNFTPTIAFDLDYRYLATTEATFRTAVPALKYRSGYAEHTLMASLVYRFGPPPAPPPVIAPPAPAPAPVTERRIFLVFFNWDKATVAPQGMRVVRQAADTYKSGAPVRLEVTGFTDRSGSAGYNRRLSERRADNVALALVRLGVPRDAMAVSGRGENDPRVRTAAGMREPQDRRVEILFP